MKNSDSGGNGSTIALWAVIGTVVVIFLIFERRDYAQKTKPFEGRMEKYLDLYEKGARSVPLQSERIPKKILVIDIDRRDKREIDSAKILHGSYLCPENLKAKTPSEVGSVVFIETLRYKVGEYRSKGQSSGGMDAYRWRWFVSIYDASSKELLYQETFHGSEPPTESKRAAAGDQPIDKVTDLLTRLLN